MTMIEPRPLLVNKTEMQCVICHAKILVDQHWSTQKGCHICVSARMQHCEVIHHMVLHSPDCTGVNRKYPPHQATHVEARALAGMTA